MLTNQPIQLHNLAQLVVWPTQPKSPFLESRKEMGTKSGKTSWNHDLRELALVSHRRKNENPSIVLLWLYCRLRRGRILFVASVEPLPMKPVLRNHGQLKVIC